jgi:hypothetical protein
MLKINNEFPLPGWPPFYTFWNIYCATCSQQWNVNDIMGLYMFEIQSTPKDTVYFEFTGIPLGNGSGTLYGYYYEQKDSIIYYQSNQIGIDNSLSRKSGNTLVLYVRHKLPRCFNVIDQNNKYLLRYTCQLENNTIIKSGVIEYSADNGSSWNSTTQIFTGMKLCRKEQDNSTTSPALIKMADVNTNTTINGKLYLSKLKKSKTFTNPFGDETLWRYKK